MVGWLVFGAGAFCFGGLSFECSVCYCSRFSEHRACFSLLSPVSYAVSQWFVANGVHVSWWLNVLRKPYIQPILINATVPTLTTYKIQQNQQPEDCRRVSAETSLCHWPFAGPKTNHAGYNLKIHQHIFICCMCACVASAITTMILLLRYPGRHNILCHVCGVLVCNLHKCHCFAPKVKEVNRPDSDSDLIQRTNLIQVEHETTCTINTVFIITAFPNPSAET